MCPLGRAAGGSLLWPGRMMAAHPLPAVTGPLFPILQTEAEACRGSGTQSQACGCQAAGVPRRALGKEGWRLDSSPAPSLLCCLLGTPKAGVLLVAGTPVPWVGKRSGNASGLERLPPLAAPVTKAGGTALNPVPLSFRTNTTMLLMKSSRPSGECGTCWGGAWGWGLRWAPST